MVVDDRPDQPANAFQTEDKYGRPVVGFTLGLIAEAANRDELAFVMGHEAAHHIAGHLQSKTRDAVAGALILGGSGGGRQRRCRCDQQERRTSVPRSGRGPIQGLRAGGRRAGHRHHLECGL
ncbi:MAG: M48 family metalloprotease [Paracoccaceae bacterium]